ncbi:MAG TPA: hypothetical protein VFI14_02215, partial [Chryseosolibacter sp.]|nr:hypothetical protein [Chryseosolibacter sp.]
MSSDAGSSLFPGSSVVRSLKKYWTGIDMATVNPHFVNKTRTRRRWHLSTERVRNIPATTFYSSVDAVISRLNFSGFAPFCTT